ncbi:hypothetical protein BGX27_000143 [Mortierella sp. AM989]|nr:hypothetical protein BGX27_000143 [Mortierella sp. AM989]
MSFDKAYRLKTSASTIAVHIQGPPVTGSIAIADTLFDESPFKWTFTLINKQPLLELCMRWTLEDSRPEITPKDIKSVTIMPRHTGLPISASIIATSEPEDDLWVSMDLSSVMAAEGFDFDIILSARDKLINTPSQLNQTHPYYHSIMLTFMRDITTTDLVFTFPIADKPTPTSSNYERCIGLFAHQAVLSKQERFAALLSKLADVTITRNLGLKDTLPIKMLAIHNFSLESFCCLIRFLYTGAIELEVNPIQFSIVSTESRQLLPFDRTKEAIADSGLNLSGMKKVSWDELFELADCYGISYLREYCRQRILSSMDNEHVIGMLFRLGRLYEDLRQPMLEYIANHFEELFEGGADPFSEHVQHHDSHALLVSALHHYLKNRHHREKKKK